MWCLRSESNQRHGDFQSPALPTELQRHTARAVLYWRSGWGSNPRPLAWQASALTSWATGPNGGNNRARTYDPLLVRQMLSQLSYASIFDRLADDLLIISQSFWFVNRFLKIFLIFFKKVFQGLDQIASSAQRGILYHTFSPLSRLFF